MNKKQTKDQKEQRMVTEANVEYTKQKLRFLHFSVRTVSGDSETVSSKQKLLFLELNFDFFLWQSGVLHSSADIRKNCQLIAPNCRQLEWHTFDRIPPFTLFIGANCPIHFTEGVGTVGHVTCCSAHCTGP